ncbi:MAG: hypothetical protein ACYDER_04170 [Ktedonobacteraceae bacterium]
MMQQRNSVQHKSQQLFTASEIAEFEYCPLVWWHQQFEPMASADTEELFARLVELEYEHDTQAPSVPEYQMIEQLLVRKGAFEEGQQQHLEHAEEVEKVQEERITTGYTGRKIRTVALLAVALLVLALILLVAAVVLH